jgi:Cu/Ag efflux protein CusF
MRLIVLLIASLLLLGGCATNEPVAEKSLKSTEPLKSYPLKGEITRLDVENKIATIKHEQIGDWMGPMTMDFPVRDAAEFGKLSEGKPVEGTVFVQGFDYWVGEVKDGSANPAK